MQLDPAEKAGRRQDALLQVRNLILFGLMSMVAMVILLWPLVSHILGYDYADHYSYYNGGGNGSFDKKDAWKAQLVFAYSF